MSYFPMGAYNINMEKFEFPSIANKTDKYRCPSCSRSVIFNKGKKYQPYFSHKPTKEEHSCTQYNKHPSESDTHLDAKLKIKTLLNEKQKISFNHMCGYCRNIEHITIPEYTDTSVGETEVCFEFNNRTLRDDVALVDNNDIKFILEIFYKHKTQ